VDFKAVIWDMDGLLLDSERLSHESWVEASQAMGVEVDEVEFRKIIGMNEAGLIAFLHESIGDRVEVPKLSQRVDEIYHEKIADGVPLKKGARHCIEWLSQAGVGQCVATSSKQAIARKKLGHHGLLEHFHSITGGDQVSRGKPHPEIYLTAARSLGIDPELCLAFEDSRHGVHAAAAAGTTVILVPDLAIHDDESHALAHEIWDSLETGPVKFKAWLG